jgi:hypothetical protein
MSIPPNTLLPPKAPNLPVGPKQYEQRYQDQLLNDLRRYFNTLDNALGLLLGTGSGGGKYVRFPYGAFQSGVDQTATVNTATAMTFNVTDYSNAVSIVSNSRITVTTAGIYNLQWSGQFENADTQLHDASVWIRVNGADVVGSNGLISVPNKHGGVNGHTIAAWNYFVELQANQYVELWWSTDDAQVSLQYYAAGTGPTRPTTASVIATLSFVSALPGA